MPYLAQRCELTQTILKSAQHLRTSLFDSRICDYIVWVPAVAWRSCEPLCKTTQLQAYCRWKDKVNSQRWSKRMSLLVVFVCSLLSVRAMSWIQRFSPSAPYPFIRRFTEIRTFSSLILCPLPRVSHNHGSIICIFPLLKFPAVYWLHFSAALWFWFSLIRHGMTFNRSNNVRNPQSRPTSVAMTVNRGWIEFGLWERW